MSLSVLYHVNIFYYKIYYHFIHCINIFVHHTILCVMMRPIRCLISPGCKLTDVAIPGAPGAQHETQLLFGVCASVC